MELYNSANDTITDELHFLSDRMYAHLTRDIKTITPELLNSCGYYEVVYAEKPSERYYISTEVRTVVGSVCQITYTTVDKPVADIKDLILLDVSSSFAASQERPAVDTGLGYSVDGGRKDLQNFEIGKEFNLPQVRDVDGNFHTINTGDYDTIIGAIKVNGLMGYQAKWTKEATIAAMTTVAECVLFEATPYVVDGVTYYKNNAKEW